jgi:hypothetical protein
LDAISVHQTRRKAKLPIQSKERPKETIYNFCPLRGQGLSMSQLISISNPAQAHTMAMQTQYGEIPAGCSRGECTPGGTGPKWSNWQCPLVVPWNRLARHPPGESQEPSESICLTSTREDREVHPVYAP